MSPCECCRPSDASVISGGVPQMSSLEQMKHMADKQAPPLLEQLMKDPHNKELLVHIAYTYKPAHQFKDAAAYFERELQQDPNNVALRTETASCLYYNGDVDGALGQIRLSLKTDPKDANSLFNLGMILWNGKNDAKGDDSAWGRLLETNPTLRRRPIVEQMIADARRQENAK
jgi:cytochrome c-type biogenesis protein CcmH/NrfG